MPLLICLIVIAVILGVAIAVNASSAQSSPPLSSFTIVDLTQPMSAEMPIWPGDPAYEVEPWTSYGEEGYFVHRITIGEHSGTHWGTPSTFIKGARSADKVPVEKLVMPAVIIDIRDRAGQDPDYRLTRADIEAWEAAHGPIPAGSIAILFTGWQARWSNPTAFINADAAGGSHWPGFSTEAAKFLIEHCQISALGTDTHGTDPGDTEDYGASFAIYAADGLILECLGGLEQLPPTGATIVVGGWPVPGGSGSTARVIGLVPVR
ncbi:MAG: cyclase family protein [Cyanobacteria bacterium P01_A01_bin.135]